MTLIGRFESTSMCGNGLLISVIWLALTPVLGGAIYLLGSAWIQGSVPEDKKALYRKNWRIQSMCGIIAFMVLWGFSITDATERARIYDEERKSFEHNAKAFCDLFNAEEKELFVAKTSDDPSVQRLKAKLDQLCPGESFQLGSIDKGRRELAFWSAQSGPRSRLLQESTLLYSLHNSIPGRWIIGRGPGKRDSSVKDLVSDKPCIETIISFDWRSKDRPNPSFRMR